jgi:hypothetical protein
MVIKKGDKLTHRLKRHIYQVVMVKRGGTVVLQSVEGSSIRLWFGSEGVKKFFEVQGVRG